MICEQLPIAILDVFWDTLCFGCWSRPISGEGAVALCPDYPTGQLGKEQNAQKYQELNPPAAAHPTTRKLNIPLCSWDMNVFQDQFLLEAHRKEASFHNKGFFCPWIQRICLWYCCLEQFLWTILQKYLLGFEWKYSFYCWRRGVNQFCPKRAHNALLFDKPISGHNTLLSDL